MVENGIRWSTPIVHIILRCHNFDSLGDACLYGGGGFSLSMLFWWHITWPDEIKHRTILYKIQKKKLISINVIEFLAIIINYCAALTHWRLMGATIHIQ